MDSNDVVFETLAGCDGELGIITLNRPAKLNALTEAMILQIYDQLLQWQGDNAITAVIIRGSGDKAFCAGGDVRNLAEAAHRGDNHFPKFFADEYRLNYLIAQYQKPYIAWCDGITMGGGVGLTQHGQCRLASEHYRFGMPETAIGFIPDVGGSYFLSRLPGELGIYLGLTGQTLNADDAKQLGIVDAVLSRKYSDDIVNTIAQLPAAQLTPEAITAALTEFTHKESASKILPHAGEIERCFCHDNIGAIYDALSAENNTWGDETLAKLEAKSPTSLVVTLRCLREGAQLTLAECLQMEYRLVTRLVTEHDFYEGVRALLIDKDHSPDWQPKDWQDITSAKLDALFAPVSHELEF